jgi:hypothetical protein
MSYVLISVILLLGGQLPRDVVEFVTQPPPDLKLQFTRLDLRGLGVGDDPQDRSRDDGGAIVETLSHGGHSAASR